MTRRNIGRLAVFLLFAAILAACAGVEQPAPTPVPVPPQPRQLIQVLPQANDEDVVVLIDQGGVVLSSVTLPVADPVENHFDGEKIILWPILVNGSKIAINWVGPGADAMYQARHFRIGMAANVPAEIKSHVDEFFRQVHLASFRRVTHEWVPVDQADIDIEVDQTVSGSGVAMPTVDGGTLAIKHCKVKLNTLPEKGGGTLWGVEHEMFHCLGFTHFWDGTHGDNPAFRRRDTIMSYNGMETVLGPIDVAAILKLYGPRDLQHQYMPLVRK